MTKDEAERIAEGIVDDPASQNEFETFLTTPDMGEYDAARARFVARAAEIIMEVANG